MRVKLKVALNEKRKKLLGFSFSINIVNFWSISPGQKVARKPLFSEEWEHVPLLSENPNAPEDEIYGGRTPLPFKIDFAFLDF